MERGSVKLRQRAPSARNRLLIYLCSGTSCVCSKARFRPKPASHSLTANLEEELFAQIIYSPRLWVYGCLMETWSSAHCWGLMNLDVWFNLSHRVITIQAASRIKGTVIVFSSKGYLIAISCKSP
ncbi:hypothetical protein VTK73DRAFT_9207 [Phialemonium thermophilum]|uniref:Uncharacterized protein n=1 Tax=Phialemonium thermophilum TaxID=223376 RepID=A0ABR3XM50_9PEZI